MEGYILALGLDPFEKGQQFNTWPLHVTVLPWFKQAKLKNIRAGLEQMAAKTRPISIKLGQTAMLGHGRDVPTVLIQPNPALARLHHTSLKLVRQAGGEVVDPNHVGANFMPHVTVKREVPAYNSYQIDQLALISSLDHGRRRVEEVYSFDAQ